MSDTTLPLEPIKEVLREITTAALLEQHAVFQERVDEINLLKDELSHIVKEAFILSADAQKSNEIKIARLLAQFEASFTDASEKMDKASQKSEERAEIEGAYSVLAQKNLDRAGTFTFGMFIFSSLLFGWTVIHFNAVRMEVKNEEAAVKAQIAQNTKTNQQETLKS